MHLGFKPKDMEMKTYLIQFESNVDPPKLQKNKLTSLWKNHFSLCVGVPPMFNNQTSKHPALHTAHESH
jgi:hypothetical protein